MCKTGWKTIPDVEEFEGIEQHTFLHIVINLLICPKARSPIDLSGKREQTHSKDAQYFFLFLFCFISLFSPFLSVQQTGYAITGVSLEHLWRKEKKIYSDKERSSEKEMKVEGFFSL